MAFYTQYSPAWLEDQDSIRIILAEVSILKWSGSAWVAQSLYFSSAAYTTTSGDTVFNPLISGDVTLSESISKDGGVAMTFGDVELANHNGDLDLYLDKAQYIWANGTIKLYYGDPGWDCADLATVRTNFLTIFNGVIDDVDSRALSALNIKVRDKLERLNCPLTENKLGTYGTWAGGQLNTDTIRPIIFGEIHNTQPLLINPATLEYQFNDGTCEGLIEIRDNGVPIYTANTPISGAVVANSTGRFVLTSPAVGVITISAQGEKTSTNLTNGVAQSLYINNIANLIATIVTQYGKAATRFTASDLDLANLSAFAANTQSVGIVIEDRVNVLNVCKDLANSIGAQLFITRAGLLQLLRYGVGYASTITEITESDILYNSLSISSRPPIEGSIKLGFCKNWTVQNNLLTNIKQAYKDNFATEWLTYTATNTTATTNYKLDTDPPQKDTMLIVQADAQAEASRLLAYYSTQRTIYKFTGTPRLLALNLGQSVNLIHSRFNLYNSGTGTAGQVVSLQPNWSKSSVEVEVIV